MFAGRLAPPERVQYPESNEYCLINLALFCGKTSVLTILILKLVIKDDHG